MMAEGLDPMYRAAYARPHKPIVRVDVWDDSELLYTGLPVQGGTVNCTLQSKVTRTGSITLDAAFMPRTETDLLAPFGNRLRIYRGIDVGGRQFMFPVFTGLITEASRKPRGPMTVSFSDRAIEVDENDFEAAEETLPNRTLREEIVRFIREGVPGAEFGDHDPLSAVAAAQVFEDSRAQACDQLADAGGAFWYALADGRYVIRRVPWAWQDDGVDVDPVVEYDEQAGSYEASTGSIIDYGLSMSRDSVYNIVVGSSEQPDGAEETRATSRDTNADSPTYVGGKFGRRVLKAELPAAATSAVVRYGVDAIRRRARASAEETPWDMIPDPALELGDVVQLNIDGRHLIRAVASFSIPLVEGGVMQCSGRPIVLPDGTIISERQGYL